MKHILSIILIALFFSAFGQNNKLSDRVGEASSITSELLAKAKWAVNTSYTVSGTASAELSLGTPYLNQGFKATSSAGVTIQNNGGYVVKLEVAHNLGNEEAWARLYVNGAFVERIYLASNGVAFGGIEFSEVQLVEDDVVYVSIDVSGTTAVTYNTDTGYRALHLSIEQVNVQSVVMADALEVGDINRIQVSSFATINNSGLTHYAFDETRFIQGSELSLSATGSIDGLQAGNTYKITANLSNPGVSAGAGDFRIVDLTTDTSLGELVSIASNNDAGSQESKSTHTTFFTPTATTSIGIDYVGGSVGDISSVSTLTVEQVPNKTVINTTDAAYSYAEGVSYSLTEIGDRMRVSFEVASVGDANQTITIPYTFSSVPKDWDVIAVGIKNDAGIAGSASYQSSTLTTNTMVVNRLDTIDDPDNPFFIITIEGPK